jgi:hypothetical protein
MRLSLCNGTLFTVWLTTGRLFQAIFSLFELLRKGVLVQQAMDLSGFRKHVRKNFTQRLKKVGLIKRVDRTWLVNSWENHQLRGYPVTPAFLLTRKFWRWRHEHDYKTFNENLRAAMYQVAGEGITVTLAVLAEGLQMNRGTLYVKIRGHNPSLLKELKNST